MGQAKGIENNRRHEVAGESVGHPVECFACRVHRHTGVNLPLQLPRAKHVQGMCSENLA